jgi:MoaA/NifB/PqqE/SkfB family radical SAM enzyme
MITIPRFNPSELKDLVQLLGEDGIDFDYKGQTSRVSGYGSDMEYLLLVSEDDYENALEILKDYFGISSAVAEPFTGECPACESHISGANECPECGLSLVIGTPPIFLDHPFYKFLESNDLLPKEDAEQGGDGDAEKAV